MHHPQIMPVTPDFRLATFEPYFEKYPAAGEPLVVSCMDERPPILGCFVLCDRKLYLQFPGGIHGLLKDLVVAAEVNSPNVIAHKGLTMSGLAEASLPLFRKKGVKGTMHEFCAAFMLGLEVASSIAETDDPNELLIPTMQLFVPEQATKDAENTVDAYARLRHSNFFVSPAHESQHLKARRDNGDPIVPHAHLVNEEHKATVFISNRRRKTAFNVRRAWDDDNPAFNISTGSIDDVVELVQPVLPFEVDPNIVLLSCAARASELRNKHLLDKNGQPLDVLVAA